MVMVWVWAQIGRKMLGSASHCTSKAMTLDMILEVVLERPWDASLLGCHNFMVTALGLVGEVALKEFKPHNAQHNQIKPKTKKPPPSLSVSLFLSLSLFYHAFGHHSQGKSNPTACPTTLDRISMWADASPPGQAHRICGLPDCLT